MLTTQDRAVAAVGSSVRWARPGWPHGSWSERRGPRIFVARALHDIQISNVRTVYYFLRFYKMEKKNVFRISTRNRFTTRLIIWFLYEFPKKYIRQFVKKAKQSFGLREVLGNFQNGPSQKLVVGPRSVLWYSLRHNEMSDYIISSHIRGSYYKFTTRRSEWCVDT